MTIQPNKIIADALIESLRVVNQKIDVAETAYNSLLTARDKLRADLEANDVVLTDLALRRDAITEHIALLSPSMSDDEIANLENTPDVIEP